jgi:hypothetical protein
MRNRFALSLLRAVLVTSAGAAGAAPAVAASPTSVTVRPITPPKVVITSGACQSVPLEYAFTTSGTVSRIAVESEVWKGDSYLTSTYAYVYPTEGGTRLATDVQNCGTIGTFRIGPTTGEWNDSNYDTLTLSDSTFVYYTARQGSRFKNAKIVRKGKTRTFTAKAQYFAAEYVNTWTAVPKGTKVLLQRRARTDQSWKTLKTVRAGKKGAVRVSTKTSKRYFYRLNVSGTKHTWSGTSKVIRK